PPAQLGDGLVEPGLAGEVERIPVAGSDLVGEEVEVFLPLLRRQVRNGRLRMRESARQQQDEEELLHGSLDTTIAACAVCIDSPGERGQVGLSRRKCLVPGTRPRK